MQKQLQQASEREQVTRYLAPVLAEQAVAALPMETRIIWTRRVWQELGRRLLGAATLPVLAGLLLRFFLLSERGLPVFCDTGGVSFLGDPVLAVMFFLGLAGAGYQSVTWRRVGQTALAGILGATVAAPLVGAGVILLFPLFWDRLQSATGVGAFYPLHLLSLLPAAGFLFAAWSAALGTSPRRGVRGGALFALATYLLFQLRDCFQTPELWAQLGKLLVMALVVFVVPSAVLGGLTALLARWVRSRRAGRRYPQKP